MQYFETKRMTDHIIRITDRTNVFSYLVIGEDRAALIDTGTGFGDMSALTAQLTDLPIIVILTHGHCDHAGGAGSFQTVYLNKLDWDLVKESAAVSSRVQYVNATTRGRYNVTEKDLIPDRTEGYLPLEDGQIFDLGGITLEAISAAGHTQGIVCILIKEERRIIFGDACNTVTFLWHNESSGIDVYRQNLIRLKGREREYDSVYLCHEIDEVDKHILDDVIGVCGLILDGTDDSADFPLIPLPQVVAAKAQGDDGLPLDGGLGNVIYDKYRVRR